MPDHVNVHDPDCAEFHDGDVTCDDVNHKPDGPEPDDDRPVTVVDLLDAYYGGLYFTDDEPGAGVLASFHRIRSAIAHYEALSPDEQAEFDRRTSGAGSDGR